MRNAKLALFCIRHFEFGITVLILAFSVSHAKIDKFLSF